MTTEAEALAREIAAGHIPPELEQMIKWRDEKLAPELEPYTEDLKFGRSLRHPLVYEVPLSLPGMANEAYRAKQKYLAEAIAEGDHHQVVFLHERPWRCWALINYVVGYTGWGTPLPLRECSEEVIELAETVWTDSENIGQCMEEWTALFDGEGWLMGDREAFDALPDPVTIYRGDIDDGGWSWTTDLKIAQFFARRLSATDDLVYATVAKEHVFAYLTSRSESELLIQLDAPVNVIKRVAYATWTQEDS